MSSLSKNVLTYTCARRLPRAYNHIKSGCRGVVSLMCVITKIRARWTVPLIVSLWADPDYMDIRDSQASSLHSFGSCFCSECIPLKQTTENMLSSATASKSSDLFFFLFSGREIQFPPLELDASWSHVPVPASSHFLRYHFLLLSPAVFIDMALIYWIDVTPRYAGPDLQTWAAVFVEFAATIFVYSAADLLKQQPVTESPPGLNLQSSQSQTRGGISMRPLRSEKFITKYMRKLLL